MKENISSPPTTKLYVVLITYRRKELLKKCLSSLHAAIQNYPNIESSINVLVSGPDYESLEELNKLKNHYESTTIGIEILKTNTDPIIARNIILKKILKIDNNNKTTWVYFIDDDAHVPIDHLKEFSSCLKKFPEYSIIGGPNLTPPGSNTFQEISGVALSSLVGTFTSLNRYKKTGSPRRCDETSLILCNLFVNAKCLKKTKFKEGLICAEETWLLQELERQGYKSLYNPNLIVWHERRGTFLSFTKQVYKYGIGRGQNIRYNLNKTKYFHLIPSIAICLIPLSIQISITRYLFILYLLSCWISMLNQIRKKKIKIQSIKSITTYHSIIPLMHISYGIGVVRGLLTPIPKRETV